MRTVWLASFPKCGNTWMRMMIAALAAGDEGDIDINALPKRANIGDGGSARPSFDFHTLIDSGLLTFDEIDRMRPAVHAAEAGDWRDEDDPEETPESRAEVRFVKCHDGYARLPDGTPLLAGALGAAGAVLIVRDPRDVAASFANHVGAGLDEAIVRMADPDGSFSGQLDRQPKQLRQRLLGWSGFARSWLEQPDLPMLLVRYEDMQADAAGELGRVMEFANDPRPRDHLVRAAELASFDRLQRQERERGFREAPVGVGSFFRRGQSGAWKRELTPAQIVAIEAAHAPMMRRLGYSLCGACGGAAG